MLVSEAKPKIALVCRLRKESLHLRSHSCGDGRPGTLWKIVWKQHFDSGQCCIDLSHQEKHGLPYLWTTVFHGELVPMTCVYFPKDIVGVF